METKKQHIKIIPCSFLLFIFGFSLVVLADDDRHTAVDQAIGGMEQGSRISSQGNYSNSTSGNPSSATIGNHGYIFTSSGLSNTPSTAGTVQAETAQAGENINTGAQAGPNAAEQTTESHPATESGSSGTTTQEPTSTSGTSSNPIVGVEVGTNPESGTPDAGVQLDTSGQLEDRQILDADVTGAGTGSSAEVGSATDVTGQELVHEADITTEPVSGTGPIAPEQINTGPSTTVQEPSGTSGNPIVGVETSTNPESGIPNAGVAVDTTGELEDKQILQTDFAAEGITSSEQVGSASDITGSGTVHEADITTQPAGSTTEKNTTQEPSSTSGNPIISVEAGANPESGTVNTGAHVDTSGQLEDRQILDAGIAGQTGTSETQVGSASDITGSETVRSVDVTTQPAESTIPIPSDLSAEVDTTGQTVGAVADIGEEADVSGISEGEDVTCNPADGITSTACGSLKL